MPNQLEGRRFYLGLEAEQAQAIGAMSATRGAQAVVVDLSALIPPRVECLRGGEPPSMAEEMAAVLGELEEMASEDD